MLPVDVVIVVGVDVVVVVVPIAQNARHVEPS